MFNIKLPINFNSPYKALDIQDFWRRWHITLSRFLKDYVYIPLGGNRLGSFRTYSNLMATFIIGGLWHGAGWTFVFWGFLHGIALVIHRIWQKIGIKLPKIVAWFITFNFINIAWVFFRAKEWEDAIKVIKGMFLGDILFPIKFEKYLSDFTFIHTGEVYQSIGSETKTTVFILVSFIIIAYFKSSNNLMKNFKPKIFNLFFIYFILIYSILNLQNLSEFLYFNF
jgi:hypothetical protein